MKEKGMSKNDEVRKLEQTARERYDYKDYFDAGDLYRQAGDLCKTLMLYSAAAHCYRKAGQCYVLWVKEWEVEGDVEIESMSTAINLFREAHVLYKDSGYYREARFTHMDEMNTKLVLVTKRRKTKGQLPRQRMSFTLSWLMLFLSKYLFGYGERPLRFVGWILLFIAIFAIVFCPSPWGFIDIELCGIDWDESLLSNFGTALYFSIVTFATLGYGDISPHSGWAKFFVCVEVAIGFVMLGALIVLIGRQITYD